MDTLAMTASRSALTITATVVFTKHPSQVFTYTTSSPVPGDSVAKPIIAAARCDSRIACFILAILSPLLPDSEIIISWALLAEAKANHGKSWQRGLETQAHSLANQALFSAVACSKAWLSVWTVTEAALRRRSSRCCVALPRECALHRSDTTLLYCTSMTSVSRHAPLESSCNPRG